MNESILFSVIVPTYNRADIIQNTIKSLLEQSYKNFEIIVVDDGSTDNTADVIRSIADPRIKYFAKENAERGAARNYGVTKAIGAYINYFDSDDLAYPNHLQTAFEVLNRDQLPEMMHLGYDYRTEDGKLIKKVNRFDGNSVKYVVQKKMVSTMSIFIRKDIAELFPFEEHRDFVMGEDALHLCRLVARYNFFYDNTITSTVIVHKNRSMSNTDETKLLFCKDYLDAELKKDDIFMKNYGKYLSQISNEYDYLIWNNSLDNNDNKTAWKYFKYYIKGNPQNIISTRTIVFFKKYIANLFA